jgi:hypothetical protein
MAGQFGAISGAISVADVRIDVKVIDATGIKLHSPDDGLICATLTPIRI